MLFMPTAGGSKSHLRPTRIMRKNVLDMFCNMLNSKFTNITFETSGIENEIFDAEETKNKTTTIYTIKKLKDLYPSSKICLGMGLDNAYQLPYWQDIDKYVELVHKIYVVPREPTAEELEKTRIFTVTNTNGPMRFDVMVPWLNDTFLKCFIENKDRIKIEYDNSVPPKVKSCSVDGQIILTKTLFLKLTSVNSDNKEPYKFYQTLPPVFVLTSEESTSASAASILSIPATSSSMMRYFIGQYLQDKDKEANLEKIQKLMFGPGVLTEEQKTIVMDTIVMDTINDYKDNVFNDKYPADDNYEAQYTSIKGFSGGNRKTKRRRTNKKRRSQKKKRRSQRK